MQRRGRLTPALLRDRACTLCARDGHQTQEPAAHMTNMTINQHAAAARENARQSTGEFGTQEHSAPEATLATGTRFLGVTGPEVPIINIATGDGYEKFTPAEARTQLNLPEGEDTETVIAVARLLAESADELRAAGHDYPIFGSQEPTYADPGDDADIDTGEWPSPSAGVEWEAYAPTWRGEGEDRFYVQPLAVIDPARHGYTGDESEAAQAIVAHIGRTQGGFDADCAAEEDGKIHYRLDALGFEPHEFEPNIVARRSGELYEKVDPADALDRIKATGIIFDNNTLAASYSVENVRAVAFAADHGRSPSDAEIAAIVRKFGVGSTLGDGFLDTSTGSFASNTGHLSEAETKAVTAALNGWWNARKDAA